MGAQHSPSGNVHHDLYLGISGKRIGADIRIRVFKRLFFRFCALVGALPVYMDSALGNNAPVQALFFGFDFRQTLAWIAAGLPFDIIHAIGNFAAGFLIMPLVKVIGKLDKNTGFIVKVK